MDSEFRCGDITKEIFVIGYRTCLQCAILKLNPKFSKIFYYILRAKFTIYCDPTGLTNAAHALNFGHPCSKLYQFLVNVSDLSWSEVAVRPIINKNDK